MEDSSYPAISTNENYQYLLSLCKIEYKLPGFGLQTSERCNKPTYIDYCPHCHNTDVKSYHCNRWDCPVCLAWTASKAALRVSKVLWGKYQALRFAGVDVGYLNHAVLSPSPSEYAEFDEKKFRKKLLKHLKKIGFVGGIVIFHPYRLGGDIEDVLDIARSDSIVDCGNWQAIHNGYFKGGHIGTVDTDFWLNLVEFSPHWHVIGYFKLKERSDSFYERTGWTYKNITMSNRRPPLDKSGIRGTAAYLFTHHRVEKGKQSYTYFGLAASNKIEKKVSVTVEDIPCPKCSEVFIEKDLNGDERSVIVTHPFYRVPVPVLKNFDDIYSSMLIGKFTVKKNEYTVSKRYIVNDFYTVRSR